MRHPKIICGEFLDQLSESHLVKKNLHEESYKVYKSSFIYANITVVTLVILVTCS